MWELRNNFGKVWSPVKPTVTDWQKSVRKNWLNYNMTEKLDILCLNMWPVASNQGFSHNVTKAATVNWWKNVQKLDCVKNMVNKSLLWVLWRKCLKSISKECFEALLRAVPTAYNDFEQKILNLLLLSLQASKANFSTSYEILKSNNGLRFRFSKDVKKSSLE